MTTFNIENDSTFEIIEIFRIMESFDNTKKRIKKSYGEFGLTLTLPFSGGFNALRLTFHRRSIEKSLNKILTEFDAEDDRSKMQQEIMLSEIKAEFNKVISPILQRLEKSQNRGILMVVKEIKRISISINSASDILTNKLYHDEVDISQDPVLFKKLIYAYKNIDLSDWKEECRLESSRLHS